MIDKLQLSLENEIKFSSKIFLILRFSFFLFSYLIAADLCNIEELYFDISMLSLNVSSKLYLKYPFFIIFFFMAYLFIELINYVFIQKLNQYENKKTHYYFFFIFAIPFLINHILENKIDYLHSLASDQRFLGINIFEYSLIFIFLLIINKKFENLKVYSNKSLLISLSSFTILFIFNSIFKIEILSLYIFIFFSFFYVLLLKDTKFLFTILYFETLFLFLLKFVYIFNIYFLFLFSILFLFFIGYAYRSSTKFNFKFFKLIILPILIFSIFSNTIFPYLQSSGFTWLNHGMFGLLTLLENINLYSDISFSIHGFIPDHLIGFFTFKNFGLNINQLMLITYLVSILFIVIFYLILLEIFDLKKILIFLILIKVNFLFLNYFDRNAPWENEFRFLPFMFIALNLLLYLKYRMIIFINYLFIFLILQFFSGLDIFISTTISLVSIFIIHNLFNSSKKLTLCKDKFYFYNFLNCIFIFIYLFSFYQLYNYLNSNIFLNSISLFSLILFFVFILFYFYFDKFKPVYLLISNIFLLLITFGTISKLSLGLSNFFIIYFNSAKILGAIKELLRYPYDTAPILFQNLIDQKVPDESILNRINNEVPNISMYLDNFKNFIFDQPIIVALILYLLTFFYIIISKNKNSNFFIINIFFITFSIIHLNKYFMLIDNGRLLIVLKFISFVLILNFLFFFKFYNKKIFSFLLLFPIIGYAFTSDIKYENPFNSVLTDIYPTSIKEEIIYFYKQSPNNDFYDIYLDNNIVRENELICILDGQINKYLLEWDYKYEYELMHIISKNPNPPYSKILIDKNNVCLNYTGYKNTNDYFLKNIK